MLEEDKANQEIVAARAAVVEAERNLEKVLKKYLKAGTRIEIYASRGDIPATLLEDYRGTRPMILSRTGREYRIDGPQIVSILQLNKD